MHTLAVRIAALALAVLSVGARGPMRTGQPPLVLLADKDYPPLSYLDGGAASGMDVDLAHALSERLGREIRVNVMEWDAAQQKVLRGEADGLLSMSMSPERRALFDFTESTITHDFGIFVRRGSRTAQGADGVEGRRIGVTPGGLPSRVLGREAAHDLVWIRNYEDGFERLAAGTIDAVAADRWVGAYTIDRLGLRNIVASGAPFATLPGGIAVRKGQPALVNDLDAAVRLLKSDGTLAQIQERWRPQEMVFVPRRQVNRVIYGAAGVLLTGACVSLALWMVTAATHARARAVLESALATSEQAQKMEAIGRLAGGIAHDFNNLLTVIVGYSELVTAALPPGSRIREDVGEIQRAAGSAETLIRQLLVFVRKDVVQPAATDLNEIVVRAERMLRRIVGNDIDFVARPGRDLGRVRADAGQIEQVLMNLVVNARDAMPEGGTLTIETASVELDEAFVRAHPGSTAGRFVRLTVEDTGHGMTPEVQAQIFTPFFSTKGPSVGTGIGLATVHGIIQQSGGWIDVQSAVGKGTRFSIYLPRLAPAPVVRAAIDAAPEGAALASATILFVEDDESIRILGTRTLRKKGFTVLAARHAVEALQLAEDPELRIDLLLTDIVMPGMTGRELAARLLQSRANLKVLYTSGYTDDVAALRDVQANGPGFIQKPYSPESLARQVRALLGDA